MRCSIISYLRHRIDKGLDVVYRFVELIWTLVHTHSQIFVAFEHADVASTTSITDTQTHAQSQSRVCHDHNAVQKETHAGSEACTGRLSLFDANFR